MSLLDRYWTPKDASAARDEGWMLVETNNGQVSVHYIGGPRHAAGFKHVDLMAHNGRALHQKALWLSLLSASGLNENIGALIRDTLSPTNVAVRVEGGKVVSAFADQVVKVTVIDYTPEGMALDDLCNVRRKSGEWTHAHIAELRADVLPGELQELRERHCDTVLQTLELDYDWARKPGMRRGVSKDFPGIEKTESGQIRPRHLTVWRGTNADGYSIEHVPGRALARVDCPLDLSPAAAAAAINAEAEKQASIMRGPGWHAVPAFTPQAASGQRLSA